MPRPAWRSRNWRSCVWRPARTSTTTSAIWNEEALALDVIDEVGPGGQFLSHEHTIRHWRELWTPTLFDRQRLDPWLEKGGKTMRDRVREATVGLLDSHRVPALPANVEAEIDAVLGQ